MGYNEAILLTGASGFLGKHLIDSLRQTNEIITLGRKPSVNLKNISFNLLNEEWVKLPKIDIVIHAAGKAHLVPKTKKEANEFFVVNVEGTKKLLNGLERDSLPNSFIFISSIAVYGKEKGENIEENELLTATDPYGKSKVEAEKLVLEWGRKNDVVIGILRLPLLLGKDAPGNFGAMVKAIANGRYLNIGKGEARKSMLLAKDVASVIPRLSLKGGVYNLTDGYHPSFNELSQAIASAVGKKSLPSIPYFIGKKLSGLGDLMQKVKIEVSLNSYNFRKMTTSLTFSDEKARMELGWKPTKVLEAIPQIV